jgi:uncharacterized membrane-anchored protein
MTKAPRAALIACAVAFAIATPAVFSPQQLFAQDRPDETSSAASAAPSDDTGQRDLIAKANALSWQGAGGTGAISDKASIAIPSGLKFLPPPDSSTFVQIQRNPPAPDAYILSTDDYGWFALFSFDPSGYVKDDEKIDPDALLKTLKDQNQQNIQDRKNLNLPPLTLLGWYVPPHYDQTTKRLEWGTKLLDQNNNIVINYTVRLLGRTGVMSATLVSDPSRFDRDVAAFKQALNGFRYDSGEGYAEFRPGDKMAQYGLTALIVGGAAAVAAKSGLGFLKFIWVGLLAAGASVMEFFRRIFGRKTTK